MQSGCDKTDLTRSFSSSSTASFAGPPKKANVFGYVKRTGSSLRRKFVKAKELAMGNKGNTKPCNRPRWKCCETICDHEELKVNNHRVRPARGSCTSYNIIYMFICSLCTKPYVGRTVNQLNIRTNQHRSAFYKSKKNPPRSDNKVERYIDDGSGTKRQFGEFIRKVNNRISCHGLNIDEHCIEDPGEYVAFLDIQFCFDSDGNLKTDLYVKETPGLTYIPS
ncbi:hypothetical protein ACHWQZ_G015868 [Mnemiopsis leidyi]